MFIDQEEKMHPGRKWFMRLMKLAFVLIALFLVFITILANMGGSSVMLKESSEKFIGEIAGGKPAVIQKLVRLSFFPLVGIDADKIQITQANADGKAMTSEVLAVFSKVRFFMDFWDMVFRTPRFRTFLMEEAFFNKGIIGDKTLAITRAYVDHDEKQNAAFIRANGFYDTQEWKFSSNLKILGSGGKYEYEIDDDAIFSLDMGDISLSGNITKSAGNFMRIKDFKLKQAEKTITGDLYTSLISSDAIKLRGDLKFDDKPDDIISLDLMFDYKQKKMTVTGEIKGSGFERDDILGDSSLRSIVSNIQQTLYLTPAAKNQEDIFEYFLQSSDLDINLDLTDFGIGNNEKASVKARIKQASGNMSLESIAGKVGEQTFEIPALVILRHQDSQKLFALASVKKIKDSLFKIISGPENLKIPEDKCVVVPLFEKNSNKIISQIKSGKLEKIKVTAVHQAAMRSVLAAHDALECLSLTEVVAKP